MVINCHSHRNYTVWFVVLQFKSKRENYYNNHFIMYLILRDVNRYPTRLDLSIITQVNVVLTIDTFL